MHFVYNLLKKRFIIVEYLKKNSTGLIGIVLANEDWLGQCVTW